MKAIIAIVLISLAVSEAAVMRDDEDELPLAGPCNQTACQLPDCRCSSTSIPGGLEAKDTPQFVLVTFDDGVNINNIFTYRDVLYGRTNKNGCPAGATFFINHEYTNYQLVNELYNEGFEPALHSMTHQTPQSYWAFADYEDMMEEFGDQKGQMAHFANIPEKELRGVRIPFLQMTGNASFQVMQEVGLDYDCTWTSQNPPGFWPYSLDYASTQECFIPPCPTASIPGPWVLPMVSWKDLNGVACAMVDACYNIPDHEDEDGWLEFIVSNFENHYLGNRAPFGFFIHEWYLATYPSVKNALKRFLDMINEMHDVFMVNGGQVIDWAKNPVPLNEYVNANCRTFEHTVCQPTNCGPLSADHTQAQYWMQICGSCPTNYPWRGNPLGL